MTEWLLALLPTFGRMTGNTEVREPPEQLGKGLRITFNRLIQSFALGLPKPRIERLATGITVFGKVPVADLLLA